MGDDPIRAAKEAIRRQIADLQNSVRAKQEVLAALEREFPDAHQESGPVAFALTPPFSHNQETEEEEEDGLHITTFGPYVLGGTVNEAIAAVLRSSKEPMTTREIAKRTPEHKYNTVRGALSQGAKRGLWKNVGGSKGRGLWLHRKGVGAE